MHVPGQRGGAAIAADLGGGDGVGLVVGAKAAMLFGDGDAEQAGAVQILVVLAREPRFAIVGRGTAGEYGLAEFARGHDDRGLFVVRRNACGSKIGASSLMPPAVVAALVGLHRHHAVTSVAVMFAFRKRSSTALKARGAFQIDEMTDALDFNVGRGGNIARHFRHHRRRRVIILRA